MVDQSEAPPICLIVAPDSPGGSLLSIRGELEVGKNNPMVSATKWRFDSGVYRNGHVGEDEVQGVQTPSRLQHAGGVEAQHTVLPRPLQLQLFWCSRAKSLDGH